MTQLADGARGAPFALRCASAVLTAWCAFFATIGAFFDVAGWLTIAGVIKGDAAPVVWDVAVVCCGTLAAVAVTRWQWRRMRAVSAGDHACLIVVLAVLGVAVGPTPFVYAIF